MNLQLVLPVYIDKSDLILNKKTENFVLVPKILNFFKK